MQLLVLLIILSVAGCATPPPANLDNVQTEPYSSKRFGLRYFPPANLNDVRAEPTAAQKGPMTLAEAVASWEGEQGHAQEAPEVEAEEGVGAWQSFGAGLVQRLGRTLGGVEASWQTLVQEASEPDMQARPYYKDLDEPEVDLFDEDGEDVNEDLVVTDWDADETAAAWQSFGQGLFQLLSLSLDIYTQVYLPERNYRRAQLEYQRNAQHNAQHNMLWQQRLLNQAYQNQSHPYRPPSLRKLCKQDPQ